MEEAHHYLDVLVTADEGIEWNGKLGARKPLGSK
jgi:hypothetical protein